MPMFYTPKPRQFHYTPRFYDPEKEEWEKLKTKYRLEQGLPIDDEEYARQNEAIAAEPTPEGTQPDNDDLEYFKRRVRDIERKDRAAKNQLTLSDLFRKREKPQFHYTPRFDSDGNLKDPETSPLKESIATRRIKRRFEEDDMDRFKPIPASKIIIYTLLVVVLLIFIFS